MKTSEHKVITYLSKRKTPATAPEIMQRTGVHKDSLRRILGQLIGDREKSKKRCPITERKRTAYMMDRSMA